MQRPDPQYVTPPFPAFPSVSRYVPLGSIADAMTRVCRSVDAREGVSLVVGPPGTGKSLLCSLLVDRYRQTHDVVILGETPIDTRSAYLRHLLHHLGADYRGIADADLQLALVDRVCDNDPPNDGLLIIVDEAQALSAEVLEAIRMSTNIHSGGQPRVFAVVVGGVRLDDTLAAPSMEPFSQRIAARCYLHPMNADETRHYVTETIQCCGADPASTITDDALAAVHHACCGVPRLVNQIMTEAIDIAEAADESLITEHTIDRAWAQLQQLPSPMIESPSVKQDGAPVEFGELDELDSNPLTNIASRGAVNEADGLDADDCDVVCEDTDAVAGDTDVSEDRQDLVASTMRENMLSAETFADGESKVKGETQYHSLVSFPVSKVNSLAERRVTVKDPSVIFGEFDDEEEVSLKGTANTVAPIVNQPPATQPVGSQSIASESIEIQREQEDAVESDALGSHAGDSFCSDNRCDDLESMLHQEIIGIADMASSANYLALHEASDPQWTESQHDEEAELELVADEVGESPATLQLNRDDNAGEDDSCEPENYIRKDLSEGSLRLTVCDDSDLLVIEEDVDLSRSSKSTYLDRNESEVSVDFHSMLQRMRTGGEV
ncbi:ExeA family protein [Novipirellula caenicola]|uniref:AAA+ ATPase domain-containing protein n=1 Tax=Novipirellula caenicola TaxID=1536901 RepID=A0ABP9VRS8_9BACT